MVSKFTSLELAQLQADEAPAVRGDPARHAEVLRLRGEGLTYEAIAGRLGMSRSRVCKILAKHARRKI